MVIIEKRNLFDTDKKMKPKYQEIIILCFDQTII
jgi:hypothetical protein